MKIAIPDMISNSYFPVAAAVELIVGVLKCRPPGMRRGRRAAGAKGGRSPA